MRRTLGFTLALAIGSLVLASALDAQDPTGLIRLPGMKLGGTITRDANGIPSLTGLTTWDLFYLQGYVHAEDRLFQMDVSRRQASGTLAELLGSAAIGSDVQLRTLGLRRAAFVSHAALSAEARDILNAYTAGVNQYVATHPLPPEYGALEITKFQPWTPLDCVVIGKLFVFSLSFDLDTDNTIALLTYVQAGQLVGFDGVKLFYEDLFRSAPFAPFSTIAPPAGSVPPDEDAAEPIDRSTFDSAAVAAWANEKIADGTLDVLKSYRAAIRDVPLLDQIASGEREASSNEWAIAGKGSTTGFPLIANDPHLSLGTPAIWYPIALRGGPFNVAGNSFAGTPLCVHGFNQWLAWGSTVNPMDVTDLYSEQIVPDAGSVSGYSTIYQGKKEPLLPYTEIYYQNNPGNGKNDDLTLVPYSASVQPATLVSPRRNFGPIISVNLSTGAAISCQYTGWSPTRELDAILRINKAKSIDEFKAALQFFDAGSQNWVVGTTSGDIAYLTSAEMPIREDLQANKVKGVPPWFIRDGSGGNEWIPQPNRPADQAVPFQVLPYSEMPQVVNPDAGWFANGNNDPNGVTLKNNPLGRQRAGGGIYYLNPGYDGYRGARIAQLIQKKLAGGSKMSLDDMKQIQSDSAMIDAQFFVPHILAALARAKAAGAEPHLAALGAIPAINAVVDRFSKWDFTTPTGIPEGYDAGDPVAHPKTPTPAQIDASVAATFYALWRSQVLKNTVDVLAIAGLPIPPASEALAALRRLLETFPTAGGHGASGVNFFNVPDVDKPEDRRDIIILKSLADALTLAASDAFAPAFAKSTNLTDYRWGKLHRIVFTHPMGGPFNTPPAGGAFPNPLGNALPGIPRQGGYEVIDRSDNSPRAASVNGFLFSAGPSRRFVAELNPSGIRAENALPGGVSGVLGDTHHVDLLPQWLVNLTYPVPLQPGPVVPWGL